MEDLFSPALSASRKSTSESAESLDSDSDTALPSDDEDLLPSPIIDPTTEIENNDLPTVPLAPLEAAISSGPMTEAFGIGTAETPSITMATNGPSIDNQNPGAPNILQEREGGRNNDTTPEERIFAGMPLSEVLLHLSNHGCRDVTHDLDKTKCSEYAEQIGGFGEVHRGALRDGRKVSLKILKIMGSTGDEKKLLKHAAHELYVWSKCKHPNILELIGMARFRNQIAMISPWMENGNLQSFLRDNPQLDRCELCVQIADSVSYLHSQGVVHGDIKGANILVSHDYTPKLADFGNAGLGEGALSLHFATTTSTVSMSIRWAAPEIVLGEIELSFKADVYALGMTILEVITGSRPYESLGDVAALSQIMIKTHPARPEAHIPSGIEQADRLWSLLTSCWSPNPEDRPTARHVREEMKAITPEGLTRNI